MEMEDVELQVDDSEEVDGVAPNPKHPCPKCSRIFANIGHMKCHFYRVHPEFRLADCIQINAKIPTTNVYNPDILPAAKSESAKTGSSPDDYQCGLCDQQFSTKSVLVKHTLKEHASPENTHLCKLCKKKFSTMASLGSHMRTHKNKKQLKMESSDSEDEEWQKDTKKKLKMEKLFCEVCNKSFNHASILETHQKTHAQENSYPCDLCNLTFKSSHYLTLHYRTHTSDKPHVCETCNAEFAVKASLDAHYRTHLLEDMTEPVTDYLEHFACDVCDAVFTEEQLLKNHILTHVKTYTCEVCNAVFTGKQLLKDHIRTHVKTNAHTCVLCEAVFTEKQLLKEHILVHAKTYTCEVCNLQFDRKHQLVRHLKTHD